MTRKRRPTKFQLGRGNMFPDGGDMDDGDVDVVYDTGLDSKRVWRDIVGMGSAFAELLPIIGTLTDAYSFYKNPSWKNAGYLAAGLASDIPLIGWAAKGTKALKALEKIRAYRKMQKALEIENPAVGTGVSALGVMGGTIIDAHQTAEDMDNLDKGRLHEVIVTPQGVSKAPPRRYAYGGKLRRRLSI